MGSARPTRPDKIPGLCRDGEKTNCARVDCAVPIFEYACRSCQHHFEAIVRGSDAPKCPSCGGGDLERLISRFAVDSPGSRTLAVNAARRQNAKSTRENAWADYEYDRKHRHE